MTAKKVGKIPSSLSEQDLVQLVQLAETKSYLMVLSIDRQRRINTSSYLVAEWDWALIDCCFDLVLAE